MSENTALTELANFVGRSSLASADMTARNRALAGITQRLLPRKRIWTRNFPSSLELEPQSSARYVLTAADFDPEGD